MKLIELRKDLDSEETDNSNTLELLIKNINKNNYKFNIKELKEKYSSFPFNIILEKIEIYINLTNLNIFKLNTKINFLKKEKLQLEKNLKDNKTEENIKKIQEHLNNLENDFLNTQNELNIYLNNKLFIYIKNNFDQNMKSFNNILLDTENFHKILKSKNIVLPLKLMDKIKIKLNYIFYSPNDRTIIKQYLQNFNLNSFYDKKYRREDISSKYQEELLKKYYTEENVDKYFNSSKILPLLNYYFILENKYNEEKFQLESLKIRFDDIYGELLSIKELLLNKDKEIDLLSFEILKYEKTITLDEISKKINEEFLSLKNNIIMKDSSLNNIEKELSLINEHKNGIIQLKKTMEKTVQTVKEKEWKYSNKEIPITYNKNKLEDLDLLDLEDTSNLFIFVNQYLNGSNMNLSNELFLNNISVSFNTINFDGYTSSHSDTGHSDSGHSSDSGSSSSGGDGGGDGGGCGGGCGG